MRKLALGLAAAALLALSAPTLVTDASAAQGGVKMAAADVKVVKRHPRRGVKKVIVKRDRHGRRWKHRAHHRGSKTVIIKKNRGGTVVKKVIRR